MKISNLITILFLVTISMLSGEADKNNDSSDSSKLESYWQAVVQLPDKKVFSIELRLNSDKSATIVKQVYKNWGHYGNNRKSISKTTETGIYKEIIRKPSTVTIRPEGKNSVHPNVDVVGLQVGNWKHNYKDQKGSGISIFDRKHNITLTLQEYSLDKQKMPRKSQ